MSRSNENAVITDVDNMIVHVQNMILHQKVKTVHGVEVGIKAETICVHGDNPEAIKLVRKLHQKLLDSNIKIQ